MVGNLPSRSDEITALLAARGPLSLYDAEVVWEVPDEPRAWSRRTHRESWVDTVNNLGMTPREAASAGGDARAELEMLLDDMDWHNDREAELGRPILMDVAWIRRELGIEAGR